jgi:predicted nucleic acid-binding protein
LTKAGDLLVDTSAAVPLVVADHEHHRTLVEALRGRRLGLAGHAAFETYSVLTRLPPPARRSSAVVARLLAEAFPATRHLGADDAGRVLGRLGPMGIGGGSVYDALVAATAASHRLPLVTRDVRALDTYRALDVEVVLIA